ncbi:hypothetical protein LOTGIDRAFT_158136 [Lottia gigantea]|uniref:Uncharacterized protein n=1 Tax=Lottia gigantea TaxID=225164 RepID=V4B149_LOTGI|nr:hypothetical protein LOTGIDRAFT_158136 [Lottia gigantea]ESO99971.1 hypothetical protein LOTGIDRAFT_158136 [Lottia gigantea]
MFQKHRLVQHEATKAVTKFGDYEKRYKLVSRMLYKLFETLEEVRMNTTLFDLKPGPLFPEEEKERASISKIYENVFLFGDLLLRMPDMVHSIYDHIRQWRYVLGWAKEWCDLSKFFEGPSKVILDAIFQEVNIIYKDEDWKPDYSNMTEVEIDLVKTYYEKHFRAEELKKAKKTAAKNVKKEKKKIKKGPRLSKNDEL